MSDDRKLCPSCGFSPWDPDPGPNREHQPPFCEECGDKLISRSELPRDIWKDPAVRQALKERPAWDIAVLRCPDCNQLGYYNEGSSFSCRFCDRLFYVGEDDESIRLDDTVTETTDGYDNHTI